MYRRGSNEAAWTPYSRVYGAEEQYWTMKNQWQSFTPDQENRFAKWRELKHLISKYDMYVHLYIT